jgi:small subunit ribosomal protein S17
METKDTKKNKNAVVVSKSGDKSVVCQIDYKVKHPRYGKYIRRRTKLGVHDPQNLASVGDRVEISECRPISKSKNWRLVKVLKKAVTE